MPIDLLEPIALLEEIEGSAVFLSEVTLLPRLPSLTTGDSWGAPVILAGC